MVELIAGITKGKLCCITLPKMGTYLSLQSFYLEALTANPRMTQVEVSSKCATILCTEQMLGSQLLK